MKIKKNELAANTDRQGILLNTFWDGAMHWHAFWLQPFHLIKFALKLQQEVKLLVEHSEWVVFWTGLECWNEAPQESLCTGRSGHILERETVGVSVFVVSADAGRNSKKKSVLQRRQTLWSACLLKVLWNFSPSGTSLPIKANKRGNCSWRGHDDSGISRRSKATLSRSHPAQKNIPQSVYIKTPCPSSGWVPRVTVSQRCRGKELLQLLWDGKIA